MESCRRLLITVCALLVIAGPARCSCFNRRTVWEEPKLAAPEDSCVTDGTPNDSTLSIAEAAYANAIEQEASGNAICVDYYYQVATLMWPDIAIQIETGTACGGRSASLYHSALTSLVSAGQRFRRFKPSVGLIVHSATGQVNIPTMYHGFPWRPDDFDALVPVGDYRTRDLNTVYSVDGLGVATVARRCRRKNERFRGEQQVFSATVILRPAGAGHVGSPFTLELFDSLRISHVEMAGRSVPLRRDLSAPFAYVLKDVQRNYLDEFVRPGSSDSTTGLFMLEPYQRGKIPVVFVHGLLSDPLTWANIANEFRARPDLMARYQIWAFEYGTGEPFLYSASLLREHLHQVQMGVKSTIGHDVALGNTVLVGHSMGGLVSKLQVTCSGNAIWDSLSNRPFEAIATVPTTKAQLARLAYFDPSPMVSRVIYVGTPHRGSPWARRSIGRIAGSLVEEPSSMQAEHSQLVRDNPDAFYPEFYRRIPTSVDLMRPDSRLLYAIDHLPVAGHVKEHSVIGSFRLMLGAGDSDGVVPVASARRRNAVSEKVVRAKHTEIHKVEDGIEELVRILRLHTREIDAQAMPSRVQF